MKDITIIKTLPNDKQFKLFEEVVSRIYDRDSPRIVLGNDPVPQFLEGCYVLLKDEKPVGRFAFYENPNLYYEDNKAACLGSYECVNDRGVSTELLTFAKDLAISKGYQYLIGPMEGSTWNNYRFSLHNESPNFFMEPFHHIYYNTQFVDNGFKSIADYFSNMDETLSFDTQKLNRFEQRCIDRGAVFRNINMDDFENELKKIGKFSIDSFSDNFLYTPISVQDFVDKYKEMKSYFNPRMVWIVENQENEIHAIIFAIKDFLDPANKTFIIKSMARKKQTPFRGIGAYFAGKVMQMAKELNYTKVIHALMLKDNVSVNVSRKYNGKEYKSYQLYGIKLQK